MWSQSSYNVLKVIVFIISLSIGTSRLC